LDSAFKNPPKPNESRQHIERIHLDGAFENPAKPPWYTWSGVLLVFAAGALPAIAAASHALADKADLHRLHRRHKGMVTEIRKLSHQLRAASHEGPPRAAVMSAIAQQAADVMIREASDWRVQYRMIPFAI
jgi:hypothetical protein